MSRLLVFLATAILAAPALHAQMPGRLSPAEFADLSKRISEPSGYFDTDNLISNEDSYLHAVTDLAGAGVTGGVYIGVGPDQNFSYIAAIRPRMAFIVDIRADNMREHLLFKALFAEGKSRIEFLALLFGKAIPRDAAPWASKDVVAHLAYIDSAPSTIALAEQAKARIRSSVLKSGIPWGPRDLETTRRFHQAFITEGLGMRLRSHGRPVRLDYPTFGDLMRQTDREGRHAGYLATEEAYQFVRSLQERNLIVPVVGDFAGKRALAELGEYIDNHGGTVSAFYTSNVEQYLFQDGKFAQFVENVEHLPRGPISVIIRSYFPYGRGHPRAVDGYLSVQLVQPIARFLESADQYSGYLDLVK